MQVGAVERRSAGHAAHREGLQLDSLAGEIGIGFVPVNLPFHAPGVALRNADLAHHQAEGDLPVVHVLANRPLCDLARGQFLLHPRPDAMCGVPLFAWRFPVGFQNPIDEPRYGRHLHLRSFCLLPPRRRCAPHRFAHHTPMHSQLARNPQNRPCAKLILTPDLLKQLHLGSPVQLLPPDPRRSR